MSFPWTAPRSTIRIDAEHAIRLIARCLRDDANLSPGEANNLADKILDGLRAAEASPRKPGLKDFRLVPPEPTTRAIAEIMKSDQFKLKSEYDVHWLWRLVYDQGIKPPEDIDLTDL